MEAKNALPRENGELVFQAPWEARAFGLAVALNEKDLYEVAGVQFPIGFGNRNSRTKQQPIELLCPMGRFPRRTTH